MSYWIEVRCGSQTAPGCYSATLHDTPMRRTRNASHAAVNYALERLSTEAVALGWKKTRDDGWLCPKCKEKK